MSKGPAWPTTTNDMKPTPKMQEALDHFQQRIKNWKPGHGGNKDEKSFYAQDRKSMRSVLSECRKGDWKKACDLAESLDTALRDEIPQLLWDAMHE